MVKTILIVFGTRPEAIKMCPLVKSAQAVADFNVVVCVTGQHEQMLMRVLDAFDVTPNYNLEIMKEKQSLFDITSNVLLGMGQILDDIKPDIVLVHGDTTTSFATSLAAFYRQIPIGHVEAGLRTRNLYSPFPEEFNRQAVDLLGSVFFAPTEGSKQNLLRENKAAECIFVTGNTGIDALRTTVQEDYSHPYLDWAADSRLILITAHRRENLGDAMHQMFRGIRSAIEQAEDVKALYPVHLNPVVQQVAHAEFDGCERIRLIEPLDVLDFHNFLARSYIILTDSGGIQEEAPSLGKPVLVMRDTTERPEGVAAGTLKLVGTNEKKIFQEIMILLDDPEQYKIMSQASNPYGDGHASERIVNVLKQYL